MKKPVLACWILSAVLVVPVCGNTQEAPAPRAMPRTSVSRQAVQENHNAAPASRQLQGAAEIIDGEKLRISNTDLRLFGVVPPQLSATFGPQARAALDALVNGQTVSCTIRDRDRDGRLLATCQSASGSDMALELLKRGLAVSARGSLEGTELAAPYLTAEQTAQSQKLGLWSVSVPAAASATASATPAPPAPVLASVKEEKVAPRTDKGAPTTASETQIEIPRTKIATPVISSRAQARIDDAEWAQDDQAGFFERYQILIAGLLTLGTALSIITAIWAQKKRDKRDETKAVAAALRGELMAARGVCVGRLKTMAAEPEDKNTAWPRIRATLYGAYVGRVGVLGAELARQVASIYGQSSDYAALYGTAPNAAANTAVPQDTSKKQALETLVKHIDEVLPKLAFIEQTGSAKMLYRQMRAQPAARTMGAPFAQAETNAARSPVALWEKVRGFVQGHHAAIANQPSQHVELDPDMHEYTALIEADMAKYSYGENVETLDIAANKKPQARTGL